MNSVNVYISNHLIDLSNDDLKALQSSHAIQSADDLQSRASSVSNVIKAPGTPRNRRIFGELYLAGTEEQVNLGVPARIELEGMVLLRGQFRYVKTVRGGEELEYHFIIVGQNSWAQQLSQATMAQLDLSAYTHHLSPEVILWAMANRNKSFFTYTIPRPSGEPDSSVRASEPDPVYPRNFDLALNLRRTLHAIFALAGYRLVSDFVDSDYLEDWWWHPAYIEKDGDFWKQHEAVAINADAFSHNIPIGSQNPGDEVELEIDFNWSLPEYNFPLGGIASTDARDPAGGYVNADQSYTIQETGGYQVSLEIELNNNSTPATEHVFHLYIDGYEYHRDRTTNEADAGEIRHSFQPTYLKAGQVVTVQIGYIYQGGGEDYYVDQFGAKFSILARLDLVDYELVDINQRYLSAQDAPLQIVKDCALLFNLQFLTDEATRTIYAEPEGLFYTYTDQVDITEKVDHSEKITLEPLRYDLPKNLFFSYAQSDRKAHIINSSGKKGSEEYSLEFFRTTETAIANLHYRGEAVPEHSPRNNLFRISAYKEVQPYPLYRHLDLNAALNIPKPDHLLVIHFRDTSFNLDFSDSGQPGLLSQFYPALQQKLAGQQIIELSARWSPLDISLLESSPLPGELSFRNLFYSTEHGRIRLMEVKNYNHGRPQPTTTRFVTDVYMPPPSVSPTSHGTALEVLPQEMLLTYAYYDRISNSGSPVDIGFSFSLEQIGGLAQRVIIDFPHFRDFFSRDYTSLLTQPDAITNLSKPKGIGGPQADAGIRDQPGLQATIIPNLANDQSQMPALFYTGQGTNGAASPIWLCEFGHDQLIDVNVATPFYFSYRMVDFGNYPTINAYLEVTAGGQTYTTTTRSISINQEQQEIVNITFSNAGYHTYTVKLFHDYPGGTFGEAQSLTLKCYAHG